MSLAVAREQLFSFLKKKDPGLKDAEVPKKSQGKKKVPGLKDAGVQKKRQEKKKRSRANKREQKKAKSLEQKKQETTEANLKYFQQTQETDDKTIEPVTQALEAVKKGVRVERPAASDGEDGSDIEATDFNTERFTTI